MAKKDIEKDSDRPHYYSQFWLDVAAGRRIIGAPKEEGEAGESETTAASPQKTSTVEEVVSPTAETVDQAEAYTEPEEEEFAAGTLEEVVDADVPDVDVAEEEEEEELEPEEEEEEDFFEEEEEEEEEWGGRARKKSKPARAVKPIKKPRRETRRGF